MTNTTEIQFPINIKLFKIMYERHVKFIIERYQLPVKEQDWISTQGVLLTDILKSERIINRRQLAIFWLFLVMNCYILGPRIAREFFLATTNETPNMSESGIQKWNNLNETCKELIQLHARYFDMVTGNAIEANLQTFLKNVDRIKN